MEVRFKNFRCFKDTGLLKLKKITLLVGENSSGKISFLAGLNHIGGLLNGEEIDLNTPPFELGPFQDIIRKNKVSKQSASFGYECSFDNVSFRWSFRDDVGEPYLAKYDIVKKTQSYSEGIAFNKSSVNINVKLSDEEAKKFAKLPIKSEKTKQKSVYRIHFKKDSAAEIAADFSVKSLLGVHLERWLFGYVYPPVFGRRMQRIPKEADMSHGRQEKGDRTPTQAIGELMESLRVMPSGPIAFSPLRTEPSRIYSFSQNVRGTQPDGSHVPTMLLKREKKKEKYTQAMNELVNDFGKKSGLFNRIFTTETNYPFSIMVELADGTNSNLMDVGYGVSQILPLLYGAVDIIRASQLLIQQPEIHLHPRAQAEYASLMAHIVRGSKGFRKTGMQFIVETHSDFILERLKYEIERKTVSHEDVNVLFFDKRQGETQIYQIDLGEDGLPKEKPPESYRKFFLEELDRVWP